MTIAQIARLHASRAQSKQTHAVAFGDAQRLQFGGEARILSGVPMDLHIGGAKPSRADEAVFALQTIMRDATQDRAILLAYVLGGRRKFLNTVSQELRGMAITEDMLTKVWFWMFARRGPDPQGEFNYICEAKYQRHLVGIAEQSALQHLHDNARRRMD